MVTEQLDCNYAEIERARDALSFLDPNCNRDTWIKYGMGLKDQFGEAGFDVWNTWSSQSEKYSARGTRSAWKSFKESGKVSISSLFFDAKQNGWKYGTAYKKPTKAEIEARQAANAARAQKAAEEKAAEEEAAAKRAQALWEEAKPLEGDGHPYLMRKGVQSYGLRVGRWENFNENTGEWFTATNQGLLIPILDLQLKLRSLQCIYPVAEGRKQFLKGGAIRGQFFPIALPEVVGDQTIFSLAEGYATAASVHAATGHPVLVCFSVSNLIHVARALRARFPEVVIIIAADNDTETEGNPGVTQALAVAREVGGLVAVPPPGDFNDLQISKGLGEVVSYIAASFCPEPLPDLTPLLEPQGEPQGEPHGEPHGEPQGEPHLQTLGVDSTVSRHEVRRLEQKQENQRLQVLHEGAMIPSALSLEMMIERCVLIASGAHVAYVTHDRTMSLSMKDFRTLTAESRTDLESKNGYGTSKKNVLTADIWKVDQRRKSAMSITFRAGALMIASNPNGEKCVNTWRPIERWPTQVDIGPLLEHISYLFPDKDDRETMLDFLAHIEQKPGELPHYGWLHIAEKTGTGRNWLASLLSRVFKGYVAPNVDLPALLDSSFNGELGGRLLAIVDEIQEGASEGNYRHAERLKSMINAETRMINNKYGMKYIEFNSCRWLIFSNHRNALPIKETDRRVRVVMHDADPRAPEIYEYLYSLIDEPEFINAVGDFLRQRDISHFKPGERPPMSAAKRAAISASKPLSVQAAQDIVKFWPSDVITYKDTTELLAGTSGVSEMTPALRRAIEEAGAIQWFYNDTNRIKINKYPHRILILRNAPEWLAQNAEAVRAEVNRAGVRDGRSAADVFADAIELATSLSEPPI